MRDTPIQIIRDGLTNWVHLLRARASLGLLNGHIAAENIARDFLNKLFDYQLVNLNASGKQSPAIDLGDKSHGVCFQVTSENNHAKIQECIDAFLERSLQNSYPNLKFLLLVEEKSKSKKPFKHPGVQFSPKDDILDVRQLGRLAGNASPETIESLRKLIQGEGLDPLSYSQEQRFQAVRDSVEIDAMAPEKEKQIVFRNTGDKTVWDVYVGSYLVTEDGLRHIVLYDEVTPSIQRKTGEVRWGDVISGENRCYGRFQADDLVYYGSTLTDRLELFLSHATWPVRMFTTVRAGGEFMQAPLVCFWSADRFAHIKEAAWRPVGESGTLYHRALQIADAAYRKRWEQYQSSFCGL